MITSWRNSPLTPEEQHNFPIEKMLGKTGLLSFLHKTKAKYVGQDITEITNQNTSLRLNTMTPLPQEMKPAPAIMNDPILWLWEDITKKGEQFDPDKFKKIWKFLRAKIYTSDEFIACPSAVNVDTIEQATQAPAASSQPIQGEGENVGDDW